METTPQQRTLETKTCGRCGGGGHYSFCLSHGTRCFGCSGTGKVYTKRGLAAVAYGVALRTVKATEVKAGWLLWIDGFGPFAQKAGWRTVLAVSEPKVNSWKINGDGSRTEQIGISFSVAGMDYIVFLESDVKAVPNKERLVEIKEMMLDYQDTLTKQGVPAKKKAKSA